MFLSQDKTSLDRKDTYGIKKLSQNIGIDGSFCHSSFEL